MVTDSVGSQNIASPIYIRTSVAITRAEEKFVVLVDDVYGLKHNSESSQNSAAVTCTFVDKTNPFKEKRDGENLMFLNDWMISII